jgi:hypothetical protein
LGQGHRGSSQMRRVVQLRRHQNKLDSRSLAVLDDLGLILRRLI